jgi:hypothetical protein
MDLIWRLRRLAKSVILLIESIDPLNEVSERVIKGKQYPQPKPQVL